MNLYYTAPSDEAFEDMRQAAARAWEKYKKDDPLYFHEKMEAVDRVQNVSDNFMYLLAMFDHKNQRECVSYFLLPETRKEVLARLIAGGNETYLIDRIMGNKEWTSDI